MEQNDNEIAAFLISLEIKGSSSYYKLCIYFAVFAVSNRNYTDNDEQFLIFFSLLKKKRQMIRFNCNFQIQRESVSTASLSHIK